MVKRWFLSFEGEVLVGDALGLAEVWFESALLCGFGKL